MILYPAYGMGGRGYKALLKQALKNSEHNLERLSKGVGKALDKLYESKAYSPMRRAVNGVVGFVEGARTPFAVEGVVLPGTAPMSNAEFKRYRTLQRLRGRAINEDVQSAGFIKDLLNSGLTDEEISAVTGGIPRSRLQAVLEGRATPVKPTRLQGPFQGAAATTRATGDLGNAQRMMWDEMNAALERIRSRPVTMSDREATVDRALEEVGENLTRRTIHTHPNNIEELLREPPSSINIDFQPSHDLATAIITDPHFEGHSTGVKLGEKLRGIFVSPQTPKGILPFKEVPSHEVKDMLGNIAQVAGQTSKEIVGEINDVKHAFRNSPPGFYRSAGSLSDNSVLNTYYTLYSLAKDPTNKVFFEGYKPLNGLGRLSRSSVPDEGIMNFINAGLEKLNFGGLKAPAAKLDAKGRVLYPSLIIQKTK